jgi:G3E family GTPase
MVSPRRQWPNLKTAPITETVQTTDSRPMPNPDGITIRTTGVADPAMAAKIMAWSARRHAARARRSLTQRWYVVDAANIAHTPAP